MSLFDHYLAFPILIGGIIFFVFFMVYKRYKSIPTLSEYKTLNPNLVNHGQVTCVHCSATNIYLRAIGSIGTKIFNVHVCKTCGSELYRS